ncbi:SpoIIE family protein phosphatase [Jannaschia sp. R86511]|uniref:SpoIIE family protein phosphatase n=1 Tax=Jannaschia sp. R86511 TaxID=3093853 RepID=UPI0036D3F4FE
MTPSTAPDAQQIAAVFRALPTPYLVMTPDLVIVDANEAYLATVGRRREEILGVPVFEAFPPTPDALDEHGVPRVQVSFERARDTGLPDAMPLQKYDIPDTASGGLSERWWSLTSVPVLGPDGRTGFVVQRAEDVTEWVRQNRRDPAAPPGTDPSTDQDDRAADWQRRAEDLESDLFARAQDLTAALEAKERAARRLTGLAELSLRLSTAETVADLADVITRERLTVLGADGAATVLPTADGSWWVPLSTAPAGRPDLDPDWLAADSTLPAATVARTGRRRVMLTRAAALASHPAMADVVERTGMQAWAFLPLRSAGELLGCLVVCWREEQAPEADHLELLDGFAAQLSQTFDRIRAQEAEAAAAREVHRLSETVQRSLLQNPPVPEQVQVAVRYVPAAEHVRVGGDWYDAFMTTSGTTLLAIGDVTGHDGTAAATMAQIRSLLRGMAYDSDDSPALLLARLDRALEGLRLDTLATAVLARLEHVVHEDGRRWQVRWSNAGHLAPVLRHADGSVELLEDKHDLLLGLDPLTPRREQVVVVEPGATLVLHTDGLIERRTVGLQDGIDRVCATLARHGHRDAEAVCDELLDQVAPAVNEDDIALLVLQVR